MLGFGSGMAFDRRATSLLMAIYQIDLIMKPALTLLEIPAVSADDTTEKDSQISIVRAPFIQEHDIPGHLGLGKFGISRVPSP